jgi:protein-disulfide isomerase
VKLVHRDFPIDRLHPEASKAHEAARCANDQEKFWAYHDVLHANAPKGSSEQLKAYAQEVGLDLAAFEHLLEQREIQAAVQQDVEGGTRAGVTGTPTFFINGQLILGAQPVDSFVRVIDEELTRARVSGHAPSFPARSQRPSWPIAPFAVLAVILFGIGSTRPKRE